MLQIQRHRRIIEPNRRVATAARGSLDHQNADLLNAAIWNLLKGEIRGGCFPVGNSAVDDSTNTKGIFGAVRVELVRNGGTSPGVRGTEYRVGAAGDIGRVRGEAVGEEVFHSTIDDIAVDDRQTIVSDPIAYISNTVGVVVNGEYCIVLDWVKGRIVARADEMASQDSKKKEKARITERSWHPR